MGKTTTAHQQHANSAKTANFPLARERINLVTGIAENRRRIQNLESNLLIKLTTVQGSLVDDPSVMEVLNVTKTTAQEVQKKLMVRAFYCILR